MNAAVIYTFSMCRDRPDRPPGVGYIQTWAEFLSAVGEGIMIRKWLSAGLIVLSVLSSIFVSSQSAAAATAAAADDIYYVSFWSLSSHKCLDVPGGFTQNNINIIQYTCNGSAANQRWDMYFDESTGYYRIVNRATGKCLDVRGGSPYDGADIIQYTCNGSRNQDWGFQNFASNYYYFFARHAGRCADILNGGTSDGAVLIQYNCNKTNNQLFKILT
ncbi:RICIN domain-containing protein [Micromonospora zamorensis]|uniref:RICIN domain-containing protein n=1 Tax=Micromonospora zamorensis TaxID=709883 RepID=A0ABZ1PJ01_9ACTN